MILLDTNVLLRIMDDQPLDRTGREAIADAARTSAVFVSAITAWEVGLLATKTGRSRYLIGDARTWFQRAVSAPGLRVLAVTADMMLEAVYLPPPFHADPADRCIVATARMEKLTVATADRAILAYAEAGHVRAIAA